MAFLRMSSPQQRLRHPPGAADSQKAQRSVTTRADHRAVRPPGCLESFRKWLWGKMHAGRFCEALEVSDWRGPARLRRPSRVLARFPVRAVPPPALGQRTEFSVSALGRAGVRGERVGGGPAPAQQADTGSNFLRGPSFLRQAPCVTLQSLLLVKPARVSAVPTQAILPFDLKIHYLKILIFF